MGDCYLILRWGICDDQKSVTDKASWSCYVAGSSSAVVPGSHMLRGAMDDSFAPWRLALSGQL